MKVERLFINENLEAVGIEVLTVEEDIGIIISSKGSSISYTLTKRELRELLDALKEYTGETKENLSFGNI